MSGHYLSIINWSSNSIIYNILWPLSLTRSFLKTIFVLLFFWIVRVRVIWQIFQLQFMIENGWPTFSSIHDRLRCLSLLRSLLSSRNVSMRRKREPTHMRPPVTDRFKSAGTSFLDIPLYQLLTARSKRKFKKMDQCKWVFSLWSKFKATSRLRQKPNFEPHWLKLY